IVDLANYINSMGGRAIGAGTGHVKIIGVEKLHGAEHTVIPDRIEAGTFMIAGAITRSEILLKNVVIEHLSAVVSKLEEIGIQFVEEGNDVRVIPEDRKSTRLNSSHVSISYAVFCLKKKKKNKYEQTRRR